MTAVHKLHEEPTEPTAIAPRDAHMQFDLGGGRSIVIRTVIDALAPAKQVDEELAFIAERGDRMRLRYDLKVMRKEIALHEKTLASGEADFVLIEQRAKAAWDARLKAMAVQVVQLDERAQANWKARGKQGAFKREGGTKTQADNLENEIMVLKAEGFKLTDKEPIERENALVTLGKHRERIEEIRREIEEAEATLNGSG